MTIYQFFTLAISLTALAIGIYAIVRNYAIDSMGELRYMLKCAKERREIVSESNEELNEKLLKISDAEIKSLEERIEKHWGKKLASNHKSVFDIIPTPNEDPDGKLIKRILRGK